MKPNKYKEKIRIGVLSVFCLILNHAYADYKDINIDGLNYDLYTETMTAQCNGLTKGVSGMVDVLIPDYVLYQDNYYYVTSIVSYAFNYCEEISGSLTIGNYVTTIGNRAFQGAGLRGTLTVGTSVTTLDDLAFWGNGFEKVISLNPIPPSCGERVFYNDYMPLYVPDESVELYREAEGWGQLYNIHGFSYETQPTSLSVNPSSIDLKIGSSTQLTYNLYPENAISEIVWESSDPSIATVNHDGMVSAISQGIALIYARAENGVTGTCTVKITDNSVASVTISPENLTLEINEEYQLDVAVYPYSSEITWSSLDPTIATVDQYGVVRAVKEGATIIYATANNGVRGQATVLVLNSKEVMSVTIFPNNLEMLPGGEEQLQAIVNPSNSNPEITWLSSDPSVVEVNEDGLLEAISPGVAIIYAFSSNGMTGLATVKVVTNEVASVTIDPDILTLELQETGQFYATIEPSVAESVLIWSSNEEGVATIDEYGVVTAKSAGVSVITATTNNGVVGMAIVRVIDPNAEDNPDLGYGDNGVYVSTPRIREGDMLGLFAERPIGYENNDWQYEWYLGTTLEAEGKSVMVPAGEASGWTGTSQKITTDKYQAEIFNVIGDELILELPEVSVYSRPLTPDELIRKGDGATCSFVAMSSLSDNQLSNLGYSFVFGYNDEAGVSHVISTDNLRYCHTSKQIYDNSKYRFWVYTAWTFPDGATITSGLRYLDGSLDERFNKSDFNFTKAAKLELLGGENRTDIYTLDGVPVGKDFSRLAPGIYIVKEIKDNVITTRKIIKK